MISMKISHVRYLIIGFWFLDFILKVILKVFDLQISMNSGGQNMKSLKISHVRYQILVFFVFQIHSDTPFGTWVVLKIANLQISMTGRGLRIKSMKLGHFMYQNYLLRKAQS